MLAPSLALRSVAFLTLLAAAALGTACARTDLGAPCHLQDAAGAEIQPQPGREYIFLGSSECESFACLATAGSNGAYCSQACAGAGSSCPSGLTCLALSLNPGYLASLQARLTPERYAQLFGQLGSSFYCGRAAQR